MTLDARHEVLQMMRAMAMAGIAFGLLLNCRPMDEMRAKFSSEPTLRASTLRMDSCGPHGVVGRELQRRFAADPSRAEIENRMGGRELGFELLRKSKIDIAFRRGECRDAGQYGYRAIAVGLVRSSVYAKRGSGADRVISLAELRQILRGEKREPGDWSHALEVGVPSELSLHQRVMHPLIGSDAFAALQSPALTSDGLARWVSEKDNRLVIAASGLDSAIITSLPIQIDIGSGRESRTTCMRSFEESITMLIAMDNTSKALSDFVDFVLGSDGQAAIRATGFCSIRG